MKNTKKPLVYRQYTKGKTKINQKYISLKWHISISSLILPIHVIRHHGLFILSYTEQHREESFKIVSSHQGSKPKSYFTVIIHPIFYTL